MRIVGMLVAVLVLASCATPPATTPPSSAQPASDPQQIVGGLEAPWSMVRLESGSTLISERDSGTIVELTAEGELRDVGGVEDAVHDGEGGLLGLEVVDDSLYAYVTTADDNRIERFDLLGEAGTYELGDSEAILTGIRKAGNHNGGRIKLGPDGMLYATVGDAGDPDAAQDVDSLNGKILRMELDGSVPADNPFDDSLVYSLGHRNPQGLAWDADGQLWAAEFGQDTWDELNRIEAGANYGWPVVEGVSDDSAFVNPEYQWATDDASPSGLAYVDGTFFLAALKGARLWVITGAEAVPAFVGTYGRLRDVVPGPDGTLWMLTNNTDGRGSPQQGDDRILQVELSELVGG